MAFYVTLVFFFNLEFLPGNLRLPQSPQCGGHRLLNQLLFFFIFLSAGNRIYQLTHLNQNCLQNLKWPPRGVVFSLQILAFSPRGRFHPQEVSYFVCFALFKASLFITFFLIFKLFQSDFLLRGFLRKNLTH